MLKDITLGQYLPGKSLVHQLDPRTKILLTIVYIAMIFCVSNPVWYVIPLAFLILCAKMSGLKAAQLLKTVKPLRFLLILTFRTEPVLLPAAKRCWSHVWRGADHPGRADHRACTSVCG